MNVYDHLWCANFTWVELRNIVFKAVVYGRREASYILIQCKFLKLSIIIYYYSYKVNTYIQQMLLPCP